MVAVWLEDTVVSVAVNVASVELAGTVTVAGTLKPVTLLDRLMVVAEVGDATVKITVQVEVVFEVRVVGVHDIVDNCGTEKTGIVVVLLTYVFWAIVNCATGLVVCPADNCR